MSLNIKQDILDNLDLNTFYSHELAQTIPRPTEPGNANVYCPFHGESLKSNKPSLSINIKSGHAKTGRFHCFGCGEEGSVFDFYMNLKIG